MTTPLEFGDFTKSPWENLKDYVIEETIKDIGKTEEEIEEEMEVVGMTPKEDVTLQFEPLKDFKSDEGNQYLQGLTYSLRKGNKRLALNVKKWVKEGKIKVLQEKTIN